MHEAAKRGVFAYIVDGTPEELQSAIDITLQRFSESKGILMARHSVHADRAFEMLYDHSQRNGRKLSDVAAAVFEATCSFFPPQSPQPIRTGDGTGPSG